MSSTVLREIRLEHDSDYVGPIMYQRVGKLLTAHLRKRDPRVYAADSYAYQDGIDDVLNEFFEKVLIGEGQLAYVLGLCSSIEDFDRMMQHQIKRFISRIRRKTVVDNLIGRSVKILRAEPFCTLSENPAVFGLRAIGPVSDTSTGWLRHAGALASVVPKLRSKSSSRAPIVYNNESLTAVLVILCQAKADVSRRDLHDFFESLLTPWVPTFLELDEHRPLPAAELGQGDLMIASEIVSGLLTQLTGQDCLILCNYFAGVPDRVLCEQLEISRPTAISRRKAIIAKLRDALGGTHETLSSHVVDQLRLAIAYGKWDAAS